MCDAYGEKIAAPLLELLGSETSSSMRRFVITLLVHPGEKAAPESLAKLRDKRWYVRRNLLCILGQIGAEQYVGSILPLCRDSDLRVRIEAVKCLVQAKDQRGAAALRQMVLSENRSEAQAAASLAGLLRARELQADLVRILRRKAARGSDFERKIPVVRALGRIGGAESEEPLREILDTQSLLSRKDLERLKEEVRLALKRIDELKA